MTPSPLAQELIIGAAKVVLFTHILLGVFSLMTYLERRILAFMQYRLGPNRTGPFGILQPVADGIKLFFKEELMPDGANRWIFIAAPAIAVVTAFLTIAVVPYGGPITLPRWAFLPDWLEGRADVLRAGKSLVFTEGRMRVAGATVARVNAILKPSGTPLADFSPGRYFT